MNTGDSDHELKEVIRTLLGKGTVEVPSLDIAINLACTLKGSKLFDLFRGQTDASWKLTSSYERAGEDEEALRRTIEKIERFSAFALHKPEMQRYRSRHAISAIAQHYGLPTPYIDFTSDPSIAGFFSADTSAEPKDGQHAAIVCLNSRRFEEIAIARGFLESCQILPGLPSKQRPQLVTLDVSNLWRLRNQRGSFLFSPVVEIESAICNAASKTHGDNETPMARIVFPYQGESSLIPCRDQMYPSNLSVLEEILRRFFENERILFSNRMLDIVWEDLTVDVSPESKARMVSVPPESYFDSPEWAVGPLPTREAWGDISAWEAWRADEPPPSESGFWDLKIPNVPLPQVIEALRRVFEENALSDWRARPIRFDEPDGEDERISLALQLAKRLWDGMRRLPYLDSEIHSSISQLLTLFEKENTDDSAYVSQFGERFSLVALCPEKLGTGSFSRAIISKKRFLEALSEPFKMASKNRVEGASPRFIHSDYLKLPCRPWQRFTFEGLRSLMVHEIIPSQLHQSSLGRYDRTRKPWIAFSPTEIQVLGEQ